MRRKPFVLAIAILGTLGTSSALAQTASVLAVVPEGAVIDVAQLPDLQANAKVGFHRPDVSGPEVAQGSIVDVRDGRALVKLNAGGDVQAGDVAVPCASLLVSGSQTDLRATIQGLKAQMAPTGGGSADLQTVLAQLESVLDARDSTIRDGACDVSQYDGQIGVLATQLQQLATAPLPPPPPGSPPSVSPPQGAVAGIPAPLPSQSIGQIVTPQNPTMDLVTQVFQFAQILFQTAQAARGGSQSPGGQPAGVSASVADPLPPPSLALAPTDPGAGTVPPVGSVPPPAPPVGPPSPQSPPTLPPPTNPPPSVTSGGGSPPRPPIRPVIIGDPPPPQAPSSRPAQPPARLPGVPVPPTQLPPWWTVPKGPPPVPPGRVMTPTLPTQPPGGFRPAPSHPTPTPGTMPTVRSPIALARPASVHGLVWSDTGQPIAGALVSVGGRHMTTRADGAFVADGVPMGRQTLVVSAPGFRPGSLALDLPSGQVEKVTLTLHRLAVSPPTHDPRRPPARHSIQSP